MKLFNPKDLKSMVFPLDKKKDNWLKALEEDKLPWTNVVDLTGEDGDIGLQYGIVGLPSNFLLDSDGKVIAKDISIDALESKLRQVLD